MEQETADRSAPLALLGVRPCDLAALTVLDRVLADGPHPDASYAERRSTALVIAVQCTRPGGTCFCASAGTGPRAGPGADVVVTELDVAGHEGVLLAEAISDAGADLLAEVAHRPASDAELAAAESGLTEAESHMGRVLPGDGLADALRSSLTSSRWDRIGERCLACGSCTLVCPTCFCSTVEDVTDLTGESTERWSRWDSCFAGDFSYLHGGSVRVTTGARYRQWLTHKLSTWEQQFGTAGCVGCGRCISWCPVGIDITEEAAALAGEVS
jgi:ferredoxin